jgi:hypothetical protein
MNNIAAEVGISHALYRCDLAGTSKRWGVTTIFWHCVIHTKTLNIISNTPGTLEGDQCKENLVIESRARNANSLGFKMTEKSSELNAACEGIHTRQSNSASTTMKENKISYQVRKAGAATNLNAVRLISSILFLHS